MKFSIAQISRKKKKWNKSKGNFQLAYVIKRKYREIKKEWQAKLRELARKLQIEYNSEWILFS